MEDVSTAIDSVGSCACCGLPLRVASPVQSELFCCTACRLVAAIVGGRGEAAFSWDLLRLGLGALLAMNVMMVSLLLYSGSVEGGAVTTFRYLLLALATPALAVLLPPFVRGSAGEVRGRRLSLHTLICLGSLAAFGVSAANTIAGRGEVYFDTSTMLPVLITVGKILEAGAKSRAADLLHALEALLPAKVLRVEEAGHSEVDLEALRPGDLLRVRPGERFAVDGVVVEGESVVEEAPFTGEYLPRLVRAGGRVSAGTVNGEGPLMVRAERVGEAILLKRIGAMVADAWAHPSRSQRMAERAAALFIPLVLMIAAGTLLFWCGAGDPVKGGLAALSVLVVACPCTLGIATPLATALAIGRAARAGVVVRGGDVMEGVSKTDLIFFDKTGTLTEGRPQLKEVLIFDPEVGEEELLGRLAVLESVSGHVLGKAVVAEAQRRGIEGGVVREVQIRPGSGISGTVGWNGSYKRVTAGMGIIPLLPAAQSAPDDGTTVIDVEWEGQVRGRLLFSDTVHPSAARCIAELAGCGMRCVLLSGDRLSTARRVAGGVGIERTEAPRTPAQKVAAIRAAVASGNRVAMVGDGINDAPALAAAHTGIALGAGTELARHAANVVILADHIKQVPWLVALSRRTRGIIRGNFAWSFLYNGVALAAAAAGMLHPLLAATAMVFSSITVLSNSLRLASFPDPEL